MRSQRSAQGRIAPYIRTSSPLMRERWIYCNRADTHWYTMDKVTPLDHPKPPKQARFPDTPGRTRTHASKLVTAADQRFESARRLSLTG
jgi:hypothetical protein